MQDCHLGIDKDSPVNWDDDRETATIPKIPSNLLSEHPRELLAEPELLTNLTGKTFEIHRYMLGKMHISSLQ